VVACSVAAVLLEGLTQELFGHGLLRRYPVWAYSRMTGPYENPIDLATYLIVTLPLLVSATTQHRGWSRAFWWAVILSATAALGRTGAMGAWLALAVGLSVMISCSGPLRRAGLVILGVLAFGGAVYVSCREDLASLVSMTDIGTMDRWAMWQAALRMIQERPLLGHGVNTFMANYLSYWVGGEQMPRYAHNCYLQVAAETGIPGAVAFLAVLGCLFSRLVVGWRRMASDSRKLLVGFLAGLLAFVVQAAIDTNFYALRQAALFWSLAGVALGFAESSHGAGSVP
jgi:putative inorganic carbon (HCO3(-)) transporter